MSRLETILNLLDEVQSTFRDILEVQVGMHQDKFERVNLDIQRINSIKELVKRQNAETNERALKAAGMLEGLINV